MDTTPLDVRAGLTRGSLILKSRDSRGYRVAMVPPAERPCHFQVLPLQVDNRPNGFALVRVQQSTWPAPISNETLFEFDDRNDALAALATLEYALASNEDAGHGAAGKARDGAPRILHARWMMPKSAASIAIILFLLLAVFLAPRIIDAVKPWFPWFPQHQATTEVAAPAAMGGGAGDAGTSAAATAGAPVMGQAGAGAAPEAAGDERMAPAAGAEGNPGAWGEARPVTTPGDAFVEAASTPPAG